MTYDECKALIAELRRTRQERDDLTKALHPLNIEISRHHYDPRPDEWFYLADGICDGGPIVGRAAAIQEAIKHLRSYYHSIKQESDELYAQIREMRGQIQELRSQLDQADAGDGLAPWRRALDE